MSAVAEPLRIPTPISSGETPWERRCRKNPRLARWWEELQKDTREVLGHAECLLCAFGGKADTGDPFRWKIRDETQWKLLANPHVKGGKKKSKLHCPNCGNAETQVFRPGKDILEKAAKDDVVAENERLKKELAAIRAQPAAMQGGIVADAPASAKPPKRGQHGGE